MKGRQILTRAYRATGAELPGGDLVGARGVSMDGWFWRITDADRGRVAFALAGLNTPRTGTPWALVGLGQQPPARWCEGVLTSTHAAERGLRLDLSGADGSFRASEPALAIDLGEMQLHATFSGLRSWRGALGGSSAFQLVPFLNQYWHPWLLGGRASGTLQTPEETWSFTDAQVYAEKNWGRGGFPESWWWGQAHGFEDPTACVAFAGGQIHLGRPGRAARLRTEVTALVVALPDGTQVRLGDPVVSPVRTTVTPDALMLAGCSSGWRIEVRAQSTLDDAFVLPVPLVEQRRGTPGALEAQTAVMQVAVWRHGRLRWRGTSRLAAVERGGRELAERALARRGQRPVTAAAPEGAAAASAGP